MIDKVEQHNVQDSTKLQTYMKCHRQYFFEYVLGYTSEYPVHNLVFGSSWHKAKEVLLLSGYSADAVELAMQEFLKEYRKDFSEATDLDYKSKNPGNAELALLQYCKEFQRDEFEVKHTEIGITVLIGYSEKYKQDRTLYGKMDSICHDYRGLFSLEHKTAGAAWSYTMDNWNIKFQTSAYLHFMMSYYPPDEVYGIIIDETIFRKENENNRIVVEKSLPFMESWLYEANKVYEELEDDFYALHNLTSDKDVVMKAFRRNTESCVQYNRICPMYEACVSWNNPLQHLDTMPAGYKVQHWDPRREDIKVKLEV